MTDIHATLCSQENRGDHAADVRIAFAVEPGETVEHLLHRVMRLGEHAAAFRQPEGPSSWIELRYVGGTEPEWKPSNVPPW
jgi:hypothetical protein